MQDKNKIAASVFNKHASTYQDKYMDVSLYAESFDFFLANVPKENPSILEIATGPGNISKHLFEKNKSVKLFGIDLAPNMIKLARENNPKAKFEVMDCRDISTFTNKYHGIMIGFCLPYLDYTETTKLIKDSANLLHSNGVIYLSTMEDCYSASQLTTGSQGDQIFMHYFEEKDLASMLNDVGFQIKYTNRYEYGTSQENKVIDLVIIASMEKNEK